MAKFDVSKKAGSGSSKEVFRFEGEIAGEDAGSWEYCGTTEQSVVFSSKKYGVLRFAKSKLKGVDSGYFECDRGFAEWVIEKAQQEQGRTIRP